MIGLVALAAAGLATAAAPPAPQLEFKGAALGMSLAAWKAAPFPGAGDRQPLCTDSPGAQAAGLVATPQERRDGELVCSYAYPGPNAPRAYVPIDDGVMARRVRYVFRGQRLIAISYRTTPDAFDAIVARIDAQLGGDHAVTRDTTRLADGAVVARVRMRWTRPAGVAELIDPIDTGRLAVLLATPAYAARNPLGS